MIVFCCDFPSLASFYRVLCTTCSSAELSSFQLVSISFIRFLHFALTLYFRKFPMVGLARSIASLIQRLTGNFGVISFACLVN